MANKRRIPLEGKEVSDIGTVIDQIAKGSQGLADRLQKILMSGKSMSRGLAGEFKKVNKQIITQARQQESMISKLRRAYIKGQPIDHKRLSQLQVELSQNKRKIQILDRVNARAEQQAGIFGKVINRMKSLFSVTKLLTTVWDILVKGFENFIDLSQKWQSAMGQIAQTTGATSSQFREMRGMVAQAASSFGNLVGAVDGIEQGGKFVQEFLQNIRDLRDVTPQLQREIFQVSRALGTGTEGAVQLMRTLEGISPEENLTDFSGEMVRFANSIGAQASLLTRDFIDSRASIAQFGEQGVETFRSAAIMANQFGFETKKIFDMMKNFDQFSSAADQVNTLNAVLGTSLSSYELMIEQDPSKRLEMIRSEIRNMGQDWDSMSRQQRMAIAAAVNLSEDEAARVFGQGASLQELQEQQKAAAEQQSRDAEMQRSNQQLMNGLLMRTKEVFETISRAIQRVWNAFSKLLAPIFREVNTGFTRLIDRGREWIEGMNGNERVRGLVQRVAEAVRDVFQWIERSIPTWEELEVMAVNAWENIRKYAATAWKETKYWAEQAWGVLKSVAKFVEVSVIPWVQDLIARWREASPTVQELWTKIKWGWDNVLKPVFTWWINNIERTWMFLKLFGAGAIKTFKDIKSLLDPIITSFSNGFSAFFNMLTQGFNLLRSQIADTLQGIMSIPGMSLTPFGAVLPTVIESLRPTTLPGQPMTGIAPTLPTTTIAPVPSPAAGFAAGAGGVIPTTAIQTAPVTAQTAQAPHQTTINTDRGTLNVVASDIILNGRVIGRAMFEISQR